MLNIIFQKLLDPQFMVAVLGAIAAAATVLTLAMPLLDGDTLNKRMKAVGTEREIIRMRERERLKVEQGGNLRAKSPAEYMKRTVEDLKLGKWLGTEDAKTRLAMAGYRGQGAETGFLFFRLIMPILFFIATLFYVFVINDFGQPAGMRIGMALGGAYVGMKAPELYLSNITTKRQLSMKRAFPDSLDLMLICVEAGMSIEHAFRRVAVEIGSQSVAMAEELTLATAELSYLSERRMAFENFAKRTGLESVKSVTTALIQAERYGTPLGTALRVLAQESRDQRMNEAEKKAASLPPKLTVPMIVFFLPVLFMVIMTPALVGVFNWK
jgi:tight adherence protein C